MIRRVLLSCALVLGSFGGLAAASAPSAHAWLWSGSAQLSGTSVCAGRGTTWVWVQAPNGESGWATSGTGRYYKNFNSVPAGGMNVTINYGNSTFRCTDTVFVRRPLTGTGLTVNLYKLVPNG